MGARFDAPCRASSCASSGTDATHSPRGRLPANGGRRGTPRRSALYRARRGAHFSQSTDLQGFHRSSSYRDSWQPLSGSWTTPIRTKTCVFFWLRLLARWCSSKGIGARSRWTLCHCKVSECRRRDKYSFVGGPGFDSCIEGRYSGGQLSASKWSLANPYFCCAASIGKMRHVFHSCRQ